MEVPEQHGAVPTPTCESAAIWAERYAPDIIRMLYEGSDGFAYVDILETNGFVRTSTSERATIWAERYAPDIIRMRCE